MRFSLQKCFNRNTDILQAMDGNNTILKKYKENARIYTKL